MNRTIARIDTWRLQNRTGVHFGEYSLCCSSKNARTWSGNSARNSTPTGSGSGNHHLLRRWHASWSFVHGHFSSRFDDYQPRAWIYASGESLDFVSVVLTAHALWRVLRCRLLHRAESAAIGLLVILARTFLDRDETNDAMDRPRMAGAGTERTVARHRLCASCVERLRRLTLELCSAAGARQIVLAQAAAITTRRRSTMPACRTACTAPASRRTWRSGRACPPCRASCGRSPIARPRPPFPIFPARASVSRSLAPRLKTLRSD